MALMFTQVLEAKTFTVLTNLQSTEYNVQSRARSSGPLLNIKRESLEDLNQVLDMIGCGLKSF